MDKVFDPLKKAEIHKPNVADLEAMRIAINSLTQYELEILTNNPYDQICLIYKMMFAFENKHRGRPADQASQVQAYDTKGFSSADINKCRDIALGWVELYSIWRAYILKYPYSSFAISTELNPID